MNPTPDSLNIFAAARAALGQPEAVAGVKSIAGIADCKSPGGPYVTELYSAQGERLYFKQIHPGREPFVAIVNGTVAWAVNTNSGEVHRLDENARAMIMGYDFLMLPLALAERFHDPAVVAAHPGRQSVYRLEATDNWGKPCVLYFDRQTGRLAGLEIANSMGEEGVTVEIEIGEWAPAGDILLPATVVITDKTGEFRFQFRPVRLNDVDETIFTIPGIFNS